MEVLNWKVISMVGDPLNDAGALKYYFYAYTQFFSSGPTEAS